jgi:hypothetical protein
MLAANRNPKEIDLAGQLTNSAIPFCCVTSLAIQRRRSSDSGASPMEVGHDVLLGMASFSVVCCVGPPSECLASTVARRLFIAKYGSSYGLQGAAARTRKHPELFAHILILFANRHRSRA